MTEKILKTSWKNPRKKIKISFSFSPRKFIHSSLRNNNEIMIRIFKTVIDSWVRILHFESKQQQQKQIYIWLENMHDERRVCLVRIENNVNAPPILMTIFFCARNNFFEFSGVDNHVMLMELQLLLQKIKNVSIYRFILTLIRLISDSARL